MSRYSKCVRAFLTATLGLLALVGSAFAQAPAAPAAPAPPEPMPPSSPSMAGPLSNFPAATFDAGPLGELAVNAVVSGTGLAQNAAAPGDSSNQAALNNGQVIIQKTDGVFQFYIQAGAYNILTLGVPATDTPTTMSNTFGAVPVGYAKLQLGKNTSIMAGSLPTLIGAEYTFSFQNMNIERGLLWNQEPAISRGLQLNQTMGKVTASLSWNDGFYSGRYSWLTGSLAYANGPHTLAFVAGGNAGQTVYQTAASPIQNNSSIYNIIYTYNKGSWTITPYWQYTHLPQNAKVGVGNTTSSDSFALLVNHTFGKGFSLPFRYEYMSTSGTAKDKSANLLFGPGSTGTSFTVTPTYQNGGFFVRGDMGFVHAGSYAQGAVFGPSGTANNQVRLVAEVGFIFGNNIKKK